MKEYSKNLIISIKKHSIWLKWLIWTQQSDLQDYAVYFHFTYLLARYFKLLIERWVSRVGTEQTTQAEMSDVLDRCQLFIDRQSFTFNASICVHIPHCKLHTYTYVYIREIKYCHCRFIAKNDSCLNNDFPLAACFCNIVKILHRFVSVIKNSTCKCKFEFKHKITYSFSD